jgi:hypothetical protein
MHVVGRHIATGHSGVQISFLNIIQKDNIISYTDPSCAKI